MNPDIIPIMDEIMARGFGLVLTNVMRPMAKLKDKLLQLQIRYPVDDYQGLGGPLRPELHEEERGAKSWQPMLDGLRWLSDQGFNLDVAGRTLWATTRIACAGLCRTFEQHSIAVDPWIKNVGTVPGNGRGKGSPGDHYRLLEDTGYYLTHDAASSRMVRYGDSDPVYGRTPLAYDQQFNLAALRRGRETVRLNHPHCAAFCVLGGGSCSVTE